MKRTQTISFRLTASFVALFCVLMGFGLAGLLGVKDFKEEASAIRDRWLLSTRYLGDLNNYTSDFRAMEATFLLGPESENAPRGRPADERSLDDAILKAELDYEDLVHDEQEGKLYRDFQEEWKRYRHEAERVFSLALDNRKSDAVEVYLTSSKQPFSAASDLLDQLGAHNNWRAQEASNREALAIQAAWFYLSAAVLVTALSAVVILLYVKRSIIGPLEGLANCMHALSSGEMGVAVPGGDEPDELGEMARAVAVFRSHAIDLRVSQRGLASQATMLEEKLAHEQRLNEQQRNFISMASHEFRTPMTIIDGHAQRIINTPESASYEKTLERAKKIRLAIKRMNAIIDNILHSTMVFETAPNLYLHKTEFDMRALIREACKLHREISPNALIVEDLGEEPLTVWGDKDLIFQVCTNLLANSIKYTARGGTVRAVTRLRGEHVALVLQDEGIGIPREDIPHIFERYYRGRNVTSIVGTGIGLCFVKIVIELHNGAIDVKSTLGKGSVFTVLLPGEPPEAKPAFANDPPKFHPQSPRHRAKIRP